MRRSLNLRSVLYVVFCDCYCVVIVLCLCVADMGSQQSSVHSHSARTDHVNSLIVVHGSSGQSLQRR